MNVRQLRLRAMFCVGVCAVMMCTVRGAVAADADSLPLSDHRTTVMIAPLQLTLPVLEVQGEFRMVDKVGVGVGLGYGSVNNFSAFEAIAKYNYYLFGSFQRGLQLGAEIEFDHVWGSSNTSGVSSSGSGVIMGPYLGYKYSARFGLSTDLQVGIGYISLTASAHDAYSSASAGADGLGPFVNVLVGWSF